MKRIIASVIVFLAAGVPGFAAETSESIPDAHPECMERNGPDCVLQGQVVPRRAAPATIIVPPGVIVAPPIAPPVVVSPRGALPPLGTLPQSGLVGSPEVIAPTSPAANTSGSTNVIAPSGQGSTIISPRK